MSRIFLPSAAIGNSYSLVTLGGSGEIQAFFYPRIDYARNVREAMFAVHRRGADGSHLDWCFGECWERRQAFVGETDILETELRHRERDLTVRFTDLMPPECHALVRRVRICCAGGARGLIFFSYFDLIPGDAAERNEVHALPDSRAVVQQFRDVALCVAATREFSVQCGVVPKRGKPGTKAAMEHGELNGAHQCIGDVDFAIGFELGRSRDWEAVLVLSGGRTSREALALASRLRETPFEKLERACRARSERILKTAPACDESELLGPVRRAVLSLADLFDENEGTVIAAPEFDPAYQCSGGYGYCWPRDAAFAATAMSRLGDMDRARRIMEWMKRTQLENGHWYQRYWTQGEFAPSWCVRDSEIQLDQTCAILHAAGRFARHLERAEGKRSRAEWVDGYRETARKSARALERHMMPDGLHKTSADLWESSHGCFTYTLGGVIAALREAREVFGLRVSNWERMRTALFERLWMPERRAWAKRITPEGGLDGTGDSSVLGLIEPWRILDPDDPKTAQVARETVEGVAASLTVRTPAGSGVLRFENESYMAGGFGVVNTLWLAQCRLRLAAASKDSAERERQKKGAVELMLTAAANGNPVGQLPELVPKRRFGYWAAPHAWACALMIECALALNELDAERA